MKIYTDGKRTVSARNRQQAAMLLNCSADKIKIYRYLKTEKMNSSTILNFITHPAVIMCALMGVAVFGLYKYGLHKDIVEFFTKK